MHPILFRIPLPHTALKLWWGLALVAVVALIYAVAGLRKKDRSTALVSLVVIGACGALGYFYREAKYEGENLPIYSYGVMLGVSLVVGWYLTLTLCERDGLPKETMANCYVITALSAIAGARLLFVLTDPHDMPMKDFFTMSQGGLVAYGGFIGGLLGSWIYLQRHDIKLLPWADAAVPSLASGLLITRIGCYLFGCDFGKRLGEGSPAFLQKLGTFPHWAKGTLSGNDGAEAFTHQLKVAGGDFTPAGAELMKMNHSFPVHPTQLYESLAGLLLLVLLLWQRKHQRFRGQLFFTFAFGYGYLRFLIELLRDDEGRGAYGPMIAEHWMISGSLFVMAIAFVFGPSLAIKNPGLRTAARVAGFVPAVVTFVMLKPASFAQQTAIQLTTSQWIGLLSALVVSYFYAQKWEEARRAPKLAMGLESLGDIKATQDDEGPRRKKHDDDEAGEGDGGEEAAADEAPAPTPKKKKKKKKAPVADAASKSDDAKADAAAKSDDAKTDVADTKTDDKADKADDKEEGEGGAPKEDPEPA